MANLKYCMECGKIYNLDDPPCPHCEASAPVGPTVRPVPAPMAGAHGVNVAQGRDNSGLIAVGFITALLIPIIGFVIGLVLTARDENKWGVRIIVGSIGAFLLWMNYLS